MKDDNTKKTTVIRTKRRQPGRRMKARTKIIIAGLLLVLLFYFPVKKMIIQQFIDYGVTAQGTIAEEMTTTALVIREEKLIKAPAAGQFKPAVNEWSKVPAGQLIGYLAAETTTSDGSGLKIAVRTSLPGLVNYHLDGLEGTVTSELLAKLDMEKLNVLLQTDQASSSPPSSVTNGQPVCKIVDNLIKPFLYLQLPTDFFHTLPKAGDSIAIEIAGGDLRRAQVRSVKKNAPTLHLVLEVTNPCDQELVSRRVSVKVVPNSYHGVILDRSALVSKEGEPGILVPRDGLVRWVKVELAGTVGEQAAVHGIDSGDLYIKNPDWVREGQQID